MRKISAGAILWLLSVQYYIVQLIVAWAWATDASYSWKFNTISDLANTHCGAYGALEVCSPLHPVMNISFVVLGLTIVGGAGLLRAQLTRTRVGTLGFICMALSGFGTVLVGLFPENTVGQLHATGAALSFIFGNAGMIVLGLALKRPARPLRIYTVLSGVIGLIALVFFVAHNYFGLGIGGLERIVAYPQTIWMTVFGILTLRGAIQPDRA